MAESLQAAVKAPKSTACMRADFGFPVDFRSCIQPMPFPDNTYHHPMSRGQDLRLGEVGTETMKSKAVARSKRLFVPDAEKDTAYWEKRIKNNTAAKRSRAKRKLTELSMEIKFMKLLEENASLKHELFRLKSCIPDLKASRQMVKCIPDANVSPHSPDTGQGSGANSYNDFHSFGIEEDNTDHHLFDLCQQFPLNLSPARTLVPELSRDSLPWQRSPSTSDINGYKMKKVPHKFRLKLISHSAFSQ